MSQTPRPPADEEPLVKIAARRAVRRIRAQATTPQFGRFLMFQAAGAAGDALVALALTDSLFFAVPSAEARGRVALYLGLTVAPFAIVAPFLSRVLDRHRGSLRAAAVASSVGRAVFAWWLSTRLDSGFLFPIAFGILILSRTALVVRGAVLPDLVPGDRSYVQANAAISKTSALAGIISVPFGVALVRAISPRAELLLTSVVYLIGAIPALRLPSGRGRRAVQDQLDARKTTRALPMRQAVVATTGMRFLVGFLVFHLAFALRREAVGSLQLGLLIASAAAGTLGGALIAPRLRRGVKEEGILVSALAAAALAGLVVGRWFSIPSAAILVFVFGMASGAAKVAFDALVQKNTSEAGRGWAFSRFESLLQLAWVTGALVPLVIPVPSGAGIFLAGVLAASLTVIYLAGRRRARAQVVP